MKTDSYINSGKLRLLHPVLKTWQELILDYIKYNDYNNYIDNPWWYNERASVSMLAAAAWTANGIALEEYSTIKGKSRKKWSGRCDLYIGLSTKEYNCEAKQVFCSVGNRSYNNVKKIEDALENAKKDASFLNKKDGQRLSVCFAVPYISKKEKNLDSNLENWLDKVVQLNYSAIAWLFPEKTRNNMYMNYYYPGVVILIKDID